MFFAMFSRQAFLEPANLNQELFQVAGELWRLNFT
jgi:hypothetical protein